MISTLGITFLLLTSLPIFSTHLIEPFEFSYPKLDTQGLSPQYIVVLGCWHSNDEQLPLVAKLHPCSLPRTVQSVQFWHEFPEAKVIFSGWIGKKGQPSHPEVNAQVAMSIGLPKAHIILSEGNADTEDEAKAIKAMIGDAEFILIASASQIPRAITLFKQQGLNPHPSPAEYISGHGDFNYQLLIPKASALYQSERGIYEILGNTWVSIKTLFK